MITRIPATDQQGNKVDVGDTIMYITVQHGEMLFKYAKVVAFKDISKNYFQRYAMVVEALNTDLKYARRILRGPTFFKCGVTLEIPTDTQIKGMQI